MKPIFIRNYSNDGIISQNFSILDNGNCTFECILPDGRYILREFTPNHKLIDALEWRLL